jgi:hypothetical protein
MYKMIFVKEKRQPVRATKDRRSATLAMRERKKDMKKTQPQQLWCQKGVRSVRETRRLKERQEEKMKNARDAWRRTQPGKYACKASKHQERKTKTPIEFWEEPHPKRTPIEDRRIKQHKTRKSRGRKNCRNRVEKDEERKEKITWRSCSSTPWP